MIPNQPLTALIENIVVLMLENRSFDNMLGGLYPTKTQAEYRGLNDLPGQDKSNPDPSNPSKRLPVFQGPADYATRFSCFARLSILL
jgi:phospholipase C